MGHSRRFRYVGAMSAITPKATAKADMRCSLVGMRDCSGSRLYHVSFSRRFRGNSGHRAESAKMSKMTHSVTYLRVFGASQHVQRVVLGTLTLLSEMPAKNGAAQDAYSICAARGVCDTGTMASQAVQEIDQIGFLLVSETDREALIIEVHHIL